MRPFELEPIELQRFDLAAGVVTARRVKARGGRECWFIEWLQTSDGRLLHVGEAGRRPLGDVKTLQRMAQRVLTGQWKGWDRYALTCPDVAAQEHELMKALVRQAKSVGLGREDAKPRQCEPQSDGSLRVTHRVGHLSADLRVEPGDWAEDPAPMRLH
jgi:hypothetical protein